MDKQMVNLTIFLIKSHAENFGDCLKSPTTLSSSKLKPQFELDGEIYYCDSNKKFPRWKQYLDELCDFVPAIYAKDCAMHLFFRMDALPFLLF